MERQDKGLAWMLRYENIAWYEDGAVRILDRRIYPIEVIKVECRTHLEVADAIRDMVTQSAGPYTAAAMGMALAAYECRGKSESEQIEHLEAAAWTISHARPTTTWRMERITARCVEVAKEALAGGASDVSEVIRECAVDQNNERYAGIGKVGKYMAQLFPEHGAVMTYCFAETIVGMMLKEARNQGKDIRLFCPETRPYFQGARLTASVGYDMGFDVMHINLHKTFSTPHGGGGPGAGPVGVRKGLEPFFPEVSPYHGNFAVAMRAYAYILSLGRENIKLVGPLATLNANYIKESLKDVYELPIDGLCKHEFVFDGLKDKSTGVTTMDVAKRLLDYGYHAPTIYFPLLFHESLMIEPTENESKETIDGFIGVMRKIAEEAKENPDEVKSAPHLTPIGRVDDVLAAKHPIVTYRQLKAEA